MFPDNSTNLSVAGVFKWIAIISGGVMLYKAFQGIVLKTGAMGSERSVGMPLTGADAVHWGLANLGYAAIAFAIAWALWFFWQRNED